MSFQLTVFSISSSSVYERRARVVHDRPSSFERWSVFVCDVRILFTRIVPSNSVCVPAEIAIVISREPSTNLLGRMERVACVVFGCYHPGRYFPWEVDVVGANYRRRDRGASARFSSSSLPSRRRIRISNTNVSGH